MYQPDIFSKSPLVKSSKSYLAIGVSTFSGLASLLYKILNEKYADAEDGAFSFIEYQYNKDAKPEKVETPIAKYDFEDLTKGDLEKISGWYISAKGNKWTVGEYSKNILK
jgi:hypothetical protein